MRRGIRLVSTISSCCLNAATIFLRRKFRALWLSLILVTILFSSWNKLILLNLESFLWRSLRWSRSWIELVIGVRVRWRRVLVFLWVGRRSKIFYFKRMRRLFSRELWSTLFSFQLNSRWLLTCTLLLTRPEYYRNMRCFVICSPITGTNLNLRSGWGERVSRYGVLTRWSCLFGIFVLRLPCRLRSNLRCTRSSLRLIWLLINRSSARSLRIYLLREIWGWLLWVFLAVWLSWMYRCTIVWMLDFRRTR